MPREKTVEDPVRISTVVSRAQHEFLEIMCIRMSHQENRRITLSEALRMAIETCYPLPKEEQMDLFRNRE